MLTCFHVSEEDEGGPFPVFESITLQLGSDFSLSCVDELLQGLAWRLNDSHITLENVAIINSIDNGVLFSQLSVVDAHAQNAGDYACTTLDESGELLTTTMKIRLQ